MPEPDIESILRARARRLAVPETAEQAGARLDLVVFRLGDERYAFDAIDAREVVALKSVTALPGLPATYRGVISHDGIVYPLIDVRPLIGTPIRERVAPASAILIESDTATVAVCADSVEAFESIDAAAVAGLATASDTAAFSAVRGVTNDAIVVLDIRVLLADARLIIDDRTPISDEPSKGLQ